MFIGNGGRNLIHWKRRGKKPKIFDFSLKVADFFFKLTHDSKELRCLY